MVHQQQQGWWLSGSMIGCFLRFCPGRLRKSKTGGTRASSRRCAEVVLPFLFALERTPLTGDEAPAAGEPAGGMRNGGALT